MDPRTVLLWKRDFQLLDSECITSGRVSVHDIPVSHQGKRAVAESHGEGVSPLLESDKSGQSEAPRPHTMVVYSIEHRMDDHGVNHSEYSNGERKYRLSMGRK